ncbi:hypothetical protein O6H91_06G131400 [Diphasiastrum complanatum]|uniref:Uncharacterized protein n=2 Tax=Diphasiastrum complanatum TaxID=34168 RepID=A0ACC2DIU0_DIPCM|nr:hypothetical protein O6H91_06G131100 [Diphasiastrum complanatum]KAJ7554219.1 hypothetical protein O6H91_06G131400 [Diphasiastrum complanatum]
MDTSMMQQQQQQPSPCSNNTLSFPFPGALLHALPHLPSILHGSCCHHLARAEAHFGELQRTADQVLSPLRRACLEAVLAAPPLLQRLILPLGLPRPHQVKYWKSFKSPLRGHNFAAIIPGDSVAELVVTNGIFNFLNIYNTLLITRLVLTWFPDPPQIIANPLSTICDPYLNIFRGLIPPLGGTIDLSPILAFLVLNVFTNTASALPAELPHSGSKSISDSSSCSRMPKDVRKLTWRQQVQYKKGELLRKKSIETTEGSAL